MLATDNGPRTTDHWLLATSYQLPATAFMWERTKRLVNSYLDNLIEKTGRPDSEVRDMTRGEVARLNEVEVQARASVKVFEKQVAALEVKMNALVERDRIARERNDMAAVASVASAFEPLAAERDMLKKQIAEANAKAESARALREERRRQGEDLATETHLTTMRESISSVQSGFDPSGPAAAIDDMRARLARKGVLTAADPLAEADRELAAHQKRSEVDEMLSRYKTEISSQPPILQTQPAPQPVSQPATEPKASPIEKDEPEEPKTLGRTEGPVRPID
jgi:hypothetical protein